MLDTSRSENYTYDDIDQVKSLSEPASSLGPPCQPGKTWYDLGLMGEFAMSASLTAPLAQLVEQRTLNPRVEGSSPSGGSAQDCLR